MASKASIEAGQGHVTLKVDKSQLQRGLEESKAYLQAWGQSLASFGAAIAGAGAAITAPFAYGLSMFASFGGALSSASRKTGIEVEQLGALSAATGGDLELFIGGIRKMSSFLDDAAQGAAGANRTLTRLGLAFGDLGNKTQDERLMMIAERLNTITDSAERAALTADIFGRTGGDLNLSGGRAGLQQRMDRARELGATISPEDAANARAYNRAMGELGTVTAAIWREFGAVLAPIMTEIVKQVVTVLIAVRQWLNENRGLLMVILGVGAALLGLGTAVLWVASGFFAAAMVIKGALFTLATFGSVAASVGAFVGGAMSLIWSATTFAAGGFGMLAVASWIWSAATIAASAIASGVMWAYGALVGGLQTGFGLFTLATWAWGAASAAASALATAGAWVYNAALMYAVFGFGSLHAIMFVWSAAVVVANAVATAATWLYGAAVSAVKVVMLLFSASTWVAAGSAIAFAVSLIAVKAWAIAAAAAILLIKTAIVVCTVIVTAAIAAFAAVVVGLIIFAGYLIWTSDIVQDAWKSIVESVTTAIDEIMEAFSEWIDFVTETAEQVWDAIVETFEAISDAVMPYLQPVLDFFANIANGIVSAFSSVIGWFTGTLFPMLRSVFSQIGDAFGAIWTSAGTYLGPLLGQALGTFNAIKNALAGGEMEAAWEIVVVSLQLAWARLSAFLQESWITIKFTALGIWGEVSAFVVDAFATAWATVKSTFLDVMSAVKIAAYGVIAGILRGMAAITPAGAMRDAVNAQARGFDLDARLEAGNRRRDREAEGEQAVRDQAAREIGIQMEQVDLEMARDDALAGVGNGNIGELEENLADLRFEAAAMALANAADGARRPGGPGFATEGGTSVAGSFSQAIISGFLGVGSSSRETRAEAEARRGREELELIRRELERRPGVVMG